MYKITLKGNYNLPIEALQCELTPSRPSMFISDEDFVKHKLSLDKLSSFVGYVQTDVVEVAQISKPSSDFEVIELQTKSKEELNKEAESKIINATGSSITNSETDANKTSSDSNKQQEVIIDATDASTKNYKEVKLDKSEVVEVDNLSASNSEDSVQNADGASATIGTTIKKATRNGKKK